jgi:hypothetical protein
MDAFEAFVTRLLHEGSIVFQARPEPPEEGVARGARALAEAYEVYRLDVAGSPPPFRAEVACAAAEVVRQASWAVVNRDERVTDLERKVAFGRVPEEPGDHLSADLVLRFLPQVYRRAKAIDSSDPLVAMLAKILRDWPLSGVLADIESPPAHPEALDFGGHPGLMLLYAERLADHDRPAWRPKPGKALDYFDLVAPGRVTSTLGAAPGERDDD